jgi:glutamate synthase (NADPH/NADH) large chain
MAMVELEPVPEEETAAAADGNLELERHGKVKIDHVSGHDDEMLKGLIQRHLLYTGSERARRVLENWAAYLPRFVKVMPVEYRRALAELAQEKLRNEQPAVPVSREVRAND